MKWLALLRCALRWSDNGVFAQIRVGLAAESAEYKTIMIDKRGLVGKMRIKHCAADATVNEETEFGR